MESLALERACRELLESLACNVTNANLLNPIYAMTSHKLHTANVGAFLRSGERMAADQQVPGLPGDLGI